MPLKKKRANQKKLLGKCHSRFGPCLTGSIDAFTAASGKTLKFAKKQIPLPEDDAKKQIIVEPLPEDDQEMQQDPVSTAVPQEELESSKNAAVKPLEAAQQTKNPFESAPAATSKRPKSFEKPAERLIDRSKNPFPRKVATESQVRLMGHQMKLLPDQIKFRSKGAAKAARKLGVTDSPRESKKPDRFGKDSFAVSHCKSIF